MRLYVGNLPYTTTEADLREMFQARKSRVSSCSIVMDHDMHRSKGYGFVEVDEASAEGVIDELNGTEYGGRRLVVNRARERAPRRATGRAGNW
jgi:RNA recognition motif-containing protein